MRPDENEVAPPRETVTVTNLTGDGKPHALALDADSEVARAYQSHLAKPVVRADEKAGLAETLTHYLAIFREQAIGFNYSVKGCDLSHGPGGGLFFNQKSYQVVTPEARAKFMADVANTCTVRDLCMMLTKASQTLATAPRTERESTVQSKVDLAALISGLASQAKSPGELAAALLKLIK